MSEVTVESSSRGRSRANNFKSSEGETLINEVEKRKAKLFGALSPFLTKSAKASEWKLVAEEVSKVSSVKRSAKEVKQRWKNMKSVSKKTLGTKMNLPFMNKTGGGEARDQLSSSEVRMLGIIGESSVCGVSGGFDTSASSRRLSGNVTLI